MNASKSTLRTTLKTLAGLVVLVVLAVAAAIAIRYAHAVEVIALAVIAAAVLALLGWLAFIAARFVRAPATVKRHYPAAAWARFRWRWLVRNLGLAYHDQHRKAVKPVPFGTSVKITAPAIEAAPRLRFPRAKIRPDAHGLVATVKTVPKVGRAEFEAHADYIADAWRCQRISVSQPVPGRLIVRGFRRDPLLVPFGLETAPPGLSVRRLWLGRDEHGNDRFADLANCPGICVGGMPGSGKSTEITSWLTQLAPHPDVQNVNLDGKGAGEFDDFDARAWLSEGDNLDAVLDKLETVHALMTARLATVRATLGVKNAWHIGPTDLWPLIVTIMDECQSFLDLTAVKGDKDLEPKVRRIIFLMSSLVRRGRSVLFLTVVATQKPTTDSLPSSIRDNCPVSLCFGVKTLDAAAATLGSAIRQYESYSPVTLADPAYAGCCTATLKTGRDPFTRLRGPYVTEDQAADAAYTSSHLRRDPAISLPVSVPDDASTLVN